MNCWQAGRADGWPVAQALLWNPATTHPGPDVGRACGLRSADERKDGVLAWGGGWGWDGGGYCHRLGESTGSWSRSRLRAEAQRADAAQTRSRIDEPENYFQIGDLIVIFEMTEPAVSACSAILVCAQKIMGERGAKNDRTYEEMRDRAALASSPPCPSSSAKRWL